MPWELDYNEGLGLIELKLIGVVSGPALRDATTEGIALAKQLGAARAIIDATLQEQTGSVTDLYDLPRQYDEEGLDRRVCIALLLPVDHNLHEIADFFETVCVNRGWNVSNFDSREPALEWLLAK